MKKICCITWIVISVSITGVCHKIKPKTNDVSNIFESFEIEKCAENADALYNRQRILGQLAETLNMSVFGTRKGDFKFAVENERPREFTVYDLTEPTNKGLPLGGCINFLNNHVYHFSPMEKRYSFSHIVILEDGDLKVFKSINCKGKGDSSEDVISYLNEKLKDDRNKQEIISRVKNYRKYGIYTTVDTPSLQCKPT